MQKLSIISMIVIPSQLFFFFFFYLFSTPSLSFGATNTLSVNQVLSGYETLISDAGNFEMGFFKPGESPNYYIGIWYKNVRTTPETVVWVANRETPISDALSSELQIVNGNLVILNESNTQIWSTNITPSRHTTSASVVLLDDGNLVLRYDSISITPIWQSFDHPTDTFLPGSKFGYNKRTNTKQIITSWKSREDPAMGPFSLEVDEDEKQYVIKWNRSVEYWASGSWNGRIFSSLPEMRLNYIFNFSYVDNENESYFTYSLYDPSIISRLIMDVSGQIQQLSYLETSAQWNMVWSQPKTTCDVYALCGAFGTCSQSGLPFCSCLTAFEPKSLNEWNLGDFSDGCVRRTELKCGIKEEKHGFIEGYFSISYLSTFLETETLESELDESACRRSCLDDCSCDAYTFILEICRLWKSENVNNVSLLFVSDDSNGRTFPLNIKVSSSDLPNNAAKISTKVLVAGIVSGFCGLVFLCSIGIIFYTRVKRQGSREENRENLELGFQDNGRFLAHHKKSNLVTMGAIVLLIYIKKSISVGKTKMEGSLVAFVYKELQIATKNFSDKLGGGGFGSVFKGVLRDSSIVAVKKLESISQGEKQFRSEVSTIGIIQHVNLVRLRGFCAQGNNKLLVYDYMENGSLDTHLFHGKQVLNWKTRYQIALGIARGLVYLHEKCRDCIIHCDIKPENILLDADFIPKIADFGLAKLVGRDFSRVLTSTRGSIGYLAPEWLSGVAITPKADVYSYGMMLFELVHGKRNAEPSQDSRSKYFPGLVANVLIEGGDVISLLDIRLNREACVEELTKVCKVACWCIQDEEESRPAMSLVERILEGVSDVSMPPIPQVVTLFDENMQGDVVFFNDSPSKRCSLLHSTSSGGYSQSIAHLLEDNVE